MRAFLSEKNLVVVLFILVLVAFSFAHEDSKKMEHIFAGAKQSLNFSTPSLSQNNQLDVDTKNKIASLADLPQ